MKLQDVKTSVVAILAREFCLDADQVRPDSRLVEDLGIEDAMDLQWLRMAIEDDLEARLPEIDSGRIRTVAELAECVVKTLTADKAETTDNG